MMILVLVSEALDSSSGMSEEEAGCGATETILVGPVVERTTEETLVVVVMKVLHFVMNEVLLGEGQGKAPEAVALKGGGKPPPPCSPLPAVDIAVVNDIHKQSLPPVNLSLSFQSVEPVWPCGCHGYWRIPKKCDQHRSEVGI